MKRTINVKIPFMDMLIEQPVEAEIYGGFAVHNKVTQNGLLLRYWTVTHTKSGVALATTLESHEAAVSLAKDCRDFNGHINRFWACWQADNNYRDEKLLSQMRELVGKYMEGVVQ